MKTEIWKDMDKLRNTTFNMAYFMTAFAGAQVAYTIGFHMNLFILILNSLIMLTMILIMISYKSYRKEVDTDDE